MSWMRYFLTVEAGRSEFVRLTQSRQAHTIKPSAIRFQPECPVIISRIEGPLDSAIEIGKHASPVYDPA